ncbi:GNAT family N-acetyltransferase [Novosphingobium piscinae]|uniref:GNAT family N-acetyltransferase n=1 Tax=Novosphingobium piscinae TaxID=1507448 RepID=A0A7X1KQY9_9SPHN|nr:GNAT family N-acetyltransferase [Novosphingobium piscinae]MBC2670211.1 GNAT family N-acetyltransferase [Novosphingobium piscinae]
MTALATLTKLTTRTGLVLTVRPATTADEPALAAFFDAVSAEDRRFRFFAAAAHVSHDQLEPLIHADHFRSESYLAFDQADGALVASALLACDNALETAEVAVSVRGDRKGRGIGCVLLDHLAHEAARRGVRRVIAIESRDNHAAIAVERDEGFVPEPFDGDPTLVVLAKTLR